MSYTPRYDRGDWNAICDVCGRQMKASALRQRWDGLKTCQDDWEPRQPQDFVRGVADYQAPPFTRPEQSNNFLPSIIVYDNGTLPISLVVSNSFTFIKKQISKIIKTNIVTSTVTLLRARVLTPRFVLSTSLATITKLTSRFALLSIVSTSLATIKKVINKTLISSIGSTSLATILKALSKAITITSNSVTSFINKINKAITTSSTNFLVLTALYIIDPTKSKKTINGKDNALNINILG